MTDTKLPDEPEIHWIPVENGTHPMVDLQAWRDLRAENEQMNAMLAKAQEENTKLRADLRREVVNHFRAELAALRAENERLADALQSRRASIPQRAGEAWVDK